MSSRDANPSAGRQAIIGAVAAAGPRGLSIPTLLELTQDPWTRGEVLSRVSGYADQGIVTVTMCGGNPVRVTITPRGLVERDKWPTPVTQAARIQERRHARRAAHNSGGAA